MKRTMIGKRIAILGLGFTLLFGQTAQAAVLMMPETQVTAAANLKQPEISAQGACLIDAATGQVLFGKNQDKQFYPASITKVMTALLTLEHCNLNDVVTFSKTATTNLESGAVSLGISEGDQLTVEQSLHGLLMKSANEIGNGLAEHISGSVSNFADLMNQKAAAVGCKNTHFANPHGLTNSSHVTTAYDMCMIMREALKNPDFRRIDSTTSYKFPAVKNATEHTITMGHKMLYPTDSRYYPGILGGKTGYTSAAGNTLVTGVERDGVRLVAVVLKSVGTHYTDTKAMLDYGFENYEALTGRKKGSAQIIEMQTGTTQGSSAQTNTVLSPIAQQQENAQTAAGETQAAPTVLSPLVGPGVSSQGDSANGRTESNTVVAGQGSQTVDTPAVSAGTQAETVSAAENVQTAETAPAETAAAQNAPAETAANETVSMGTVLVPIETAAPAQTEAAAVQVPAESAAVSETAAETAPAAAVQGNVVVGLAPSAGNP